MISQPSSPVLKARRQSNKLYSNVLSCLLVFSLFLWLLRLAFFNDEGRAHFKGRTEEHGSWVPNASGRHPLVDTRLGHALSNSESMVNNSTHVSLAAILPVTSTSISDLDSHLHSLFETSNALVEIIILSPQVYHPQIRRALRNLLSTNQHLEVELSIAHSLEGVHQGVSVIQAAQGATTDWVLLTDERGLLDMDIATRDLLLMKTMPSTLLPIGPRGFRTHRYGTSCVLYPSGPENAAYLVPPFVLPRSLLSSAPYPTSLRDPWRALGNQVSRMKSDLPGGLVLRSFDASVTWCQRYAPIDLASSPLLDSGMKMDVVDSMARDSTETCHAGSGTVLLAIHWEDRRYISSIACGLARQGHHVTLLVLNHDWVERKLLTIQLEECPSAVINHIPALFTQLAESKTRDELLSRIAEDIDVIISTVTEGYFSLLLASVGSRARSLDHSIADIRIPREDLPYCDWMAALTLVEWKSWHIPRIDLSVITDARPHSLRRLLSSLTNARYFGDTLNLRINMEQTADPETLRIVSEFEWPHGNVVLHHRVVHGGLMAAVVESWYPHDNHSYGVILEDDVELSALFYAWTKMSLLSYRYGRPEDRSPNLFGISLYQQKNLELHPQGRQLFDARAAFSSAGLAHPDTPYLSQIPCSWGALYFPEHWREFHAYLPARLSSLAGWSLAAPVVPAVRSNRWARSWKRFFIELVYLRGYVMLYPNYAAFASLSTNHLETGSHVRDVPPDAYLRKKKLFDLPLMPLPSATTNDNHSGHVPGTGLLELPDACLPKWTSLPVLDLLGTIVDADTLVRRGRERRMELTGCDGVSTKAYDVPELLCMH